jgi:hypothetical protein
LFQSIHMSRRPSEVITSLRAKAEEAKQKVKVTSSIIKVGRNARFCPSGHCFNRVLLRQRQRTIQEEQDLPANILPDVACDACSIDIHEEYIAGSCKSCDLDFCQECFESGVPIEELLDGGQDLELDATASLSMSEMTMSVTNEKCSLGHPLCRVLTIRRRRYLQERDGLSSSPSIECDCCSRTINSDYIAGCCVHCDIDFCEGCFQSGQSFADMLEEPILVDEEEPAPAFRERYNGQRPTYKRSGRVSYDVYPDPTSFQWAFTGSCEAACVEFFEKDFGTRLGVVRLDFFYAKGKIRTILEHRKKGVRPLFTKDKKISSKLYRKILLDPRGHAQKSARKQVL